VSAGSVALLTRLPVEGRYFWDLFPAYVLGGAGLAFAFVSVTIASLAGVRPSDAGVAHPGVAPTSPVALDHGFQTALYVLTGILVLGALIAGGLVRPRPRPVEGDQRGPPKSGVGHAVCRRSRRRT
jgi:hypothetical protein